MLVVAEKVTASLAFYGTPNELAALTQSGANTKDLRVKRGCEPIHNTPHSHRVRLGAARTAAHRAEVVVAPLINHPLPPWVAEKGLRLVAGHSIATTFQKCSDFPSPQSATESSDKKQTTSIWSWFISPQSRP